MEKKPEDHPLPPEYHLSLGTFLSRLKLARLVISDEQETRLFELLARLSASGSEPRTIGAFASLVTPILAGTPRQQALCHDIALHVFGSDEGPVETPLVAARDRTRDNRIFSRLLTYAPPAWMLAVLLAVLVGLWFAADSYFAMQRPDGLPIAPEPRASSNYGDLQSLDWIYDIKIKELEPPEQSWRNRTWRWFYTEYGPAKWIAALGPWLIYAAIMAALIWALLAHLQREKAKRNVADLPYTFRGDRPVFGDRALTGDLQPLRKVPAAHVPEFDAEASVDASVHSAGIPNAIYRDRIVPVEFVTLVDRRAPRDHFAAFGDVFFDSLNAAGIRTERHYFNTSPVFLTNARTGETDRADAILGRLAGSVVLAFLTEDEIFDPMTGGARSWLADMSNHGSVFLFVPESQAAQPLLHKILPPGVTVLPASPEGLRQLTDRLTEAPARPGLSSVLHPMDALFAFLSERKGRWLQAAPIPEDEIEALILEIRKGAGKSGLQWVAATSVYPELRWPMTLRLRDRLGDRLKRAARLDSDLLRVVQLPWFRSGRMPQWLRARLIRELPAGLSDRIRNVLLEAMGLGGADARDARSLGIVRENNEQSRGEKARTDRLMLRYLLAGQRLPKGIFTVPRDFARKISRRPLRNTALAGVAGAFIAATASFASLASLPIHNCDLWGASLFAPDRVGPGWTNKLTRRGGYTKQVIQACEQAKTADPDNPRFQYQYARALTLRRQLSDAEKRVVLSLYEVLSEQNYAPALNSLGYHYKGKTSMNFPPDQLKATEYYQRAYAAGSLEALSNLAARYYELGKTDPIYFVKRKAILEQHYSEGGVLVFAYAKGYRDGTPGFTKNQKRYIEIALEGAKRGDGRAANEVGVLYARGDLGCSSVTNCEPDQASAVKYYQLAIELDGNPVAALNLARRYQSGVGIEPDRDKAFYWTVFAARQGETEAAELLMQLVAEAKNETLRKWGLEREAIKSKLEEGASNLKIGHSQLQTQYLLGVYLEERGAGDEALRYYHLAAEAGYEPASNALERLESNDQEFDTPEK